MKPEIVTCCPQNDSQHGNEHVQTPKYGKMPEEVHDIRQQMKPENAPCRPARDVSQHSKQAVDTQDYDQLRHLKLRI